MKILLDLFCGGHFDNDVALLIRFGENKGVCEESFILMVPSKSIELISEASAVS